MKISTTHAQRISFASLIAALIPRSEYTSRIAAKAARLVRETGCSYEFAARNAVAESRALELNA